MLKWQILGYANYNFSFRQVSRTKKRLEAFVLRAIGDFSLHDNAINIADLKVLIIINLYTPLEVFFILFS